METGDLKLANSGKLKQTLANYSKDRRQIRLYDYCSRVHGGWRMEDLVTNNDLNTFL